MGSEMILREQKKEDEVAVDEKGKVVSSEGGRRVKLT